MCHDSGLIGPDFIDRLAETQLQNGLETDAAALRANARAWQEDRRTLEHLRAQVEAADARFATLRHQVQRLSA